MKKLASYFTLLLIILLVQAKPAFSQNLTDLGLNDDVIPFKSYYLINAQTTELIPKHSFQFSIRHRFGAIEPNKSLVTEFLGMDITANIQFSFAFPLGNKTMFSAGRTKIDKTYYLDVKRKLFNQKSNNSMPVSVAVYANASIKSDEFKPVPNNSYFSDGITPFENKFNHRLYYSTQLIVSRSFADRISVQLAAVYVYQNLSPYGYENQTLAIPFSASIKTGLKSSFIAEYAYRFKNQPVNGIYPLSIGYEFGTAGHVFQVIISSSKSLDEGMLYTTESYDYTEGEFLLGFNLKRTFWHKKKLAKIQKSQLQ